MCAQMCANQQADTKVHVCTHACPHINETHTQICVCVLCTYAHGYACTDTNMCVVISKANFISFRKERTKRKFRKKKKKKQTALGCNPV